MVHSAYAREAGKGRLSLCGTFFGTTYLLI